MGGLISEVDGQQQPAAAPAPQADAQGAQASPEEQQWYDAVQNASADILFDNDEASAAVLKMLNPEQPGLSAGTAAAEIMLRIDRGMDGEVPDAVILPASEEILGHILDIGQAAGVFQRSPEIDEEAAQAMVARLADDYGIDEADFQQGMQAAKGMGVG